MKPRIIVRKQKGVKASELAFEMRVDVKEVLSVCRGMGISVNSPSSVLEYDDAKKIKDLIYKQKSEVKAAPVSDAPLKEIKLNNDTSVKDLAEILGIKVGEVIKELMKLKIMATINQRIDVSIAAEVAKVFGAFISSPEASETHHAPLGHKDDSVHMLPRPPIVVVMGHVDHGKTKLLDAIRKTNVIDTEAGGITQHIGAYQVLVKDKKVTFLDTPGHEAFTALRSRGAKVTDIAILVVAADDGMMPQTIEAMDHAKAAKVPIIVAINKIDKPAADVERVKKQLMDHDLTPEEWGGKTVTVAVSAKSGKGVDELLDMILLVADLQELKANASRSATGIVIEAKLDKGRGPVTSVLIGNGTLKVGDCFYVGGVTGKVRALINDKGERIEKALPSTPVEVLGAETVPVPGDVFRVVHDEATARKLAEKRKFEIDTQKQQKGKVISLEDFSRSVKEGQRKDLNVILKADVQGSLEAIKAMLLNLSTNDVRVNAIHSAVGNVSESDVSLALASRAIIIGFNVAFEAAAENLAEDKGVETKIYSIIYQIQDDIKLAMQGLLEPIKEEVVIGHAHVKAIFRYSKLGTIAGCNVLDGKMLRGAFIRVSREGKKTYEGKLESLKRFKEDVKEVLAGFECGVAVRGFNDFKEEDAIECYEIKTVLRKL